ncbi:hypothetical protein GCK72_011005 [Caenorhabditis remanei]|uniref:RING-type domain-containing protein n=1 Tax=Caenorhabditis remanei TaxID=31234 RepID=A0A6A5H8A8_CAERE|nr:hypothetical protein GCK72_011005 [Caenorhabditis remanei]KAF1762743.1 hypothetical protein GCK72_011005 [Caenorhabditis remanei]
MNVEPGFKKYYDRVTISKALSDYIPAPLCEHFDKSIFDAKKLKCSKETIRKTLQTVLDNSNKQLKQYGNCDDLLENLNIYMNFPLNYKRFGDPEKDLFEDIKSDKKPYQFKSLKGSLFVLKQDFLLHLRMQVFTNFMKTMYQPAPEVMEFMIKNERPLNNCCEFIRHDEDLFTEIHKRAKELKGNSCFELDEFIDILHPLMPIMNDRKQNEEANSESETTKSGLEFMQGIIDSYPYVFRPNSEINSPDVPIVVRIFEDGDHKFVMKSELFKDSRVKNSDEKIQKLKDENGILWAVDYEEVVQKFKDQIDQIEFISVPIQRAKHAAVPIVTPSGDHCILASDAVYELLRRLISALKVFQNFNKDRWQMVTHYMNFLSSKIDLEATNRFFISTTFFDKIKEETDNYWLKRSRGNSKKNQRVTSPRLVRDVGKLGFSLEFLKEELKLLGLTKAFPDVLDYAELSYSLVFNQRKYQFLRTCDLIDAVEHCQLACVIKKFPKLSEFLRNQKMCSNLSDRYDYLDDKSKKESNIEKSTEDTNKIEETETVDSAGIADGESEEVPIDRIKDSEASIETSEGKNEDSVTIPENENSDFRSLKEPEKEEVTEQKNEIESTGQNSESTESNESTSCLECLKMKEMREELEISLEKIRIEELTHEKILENRALEKMKESINAELEKLRLMNNRIQSIEENKLKEIDRMRVEIEKKNAVCEELREKWLDCSNTMKRSEERESVIRETVKRIEKLETGLKELDDEREQMKRNNAKLLKRKEKEIETLITNAANSREEKRKLKLENKEMKRKLEQEIQSSQQKFDQYQTELNRLKIEISEKNRVIEELKKENSELISDQEVSRKELDDTMSRISIYQEKHAKIFRELLGGSTTSMATSSESSTSKKMPSPFEIQMNSFQRIKDSIDINNSLKLAKEMVEKLISVSNRPEIHQFANYEFQQYEGKIRNYSQAVELNIHNLKKSSDISSICPLPEFPSFSDKFMTEYWTEIDKKPSIELSDSECYICFSEMKSDEKTLECEHCKKITHLECASKWLQIHRSCGHCRQKQLDPNEFPTLS